MWLIFTIWVLRSNFSVSEVWGFRAFIIGGGSNVVEYALDWTIGNIAISPTVKTTLASLAFRDQVRAGFSARPACGQVGSLILYIRADFRPTPHWRTGCMMTLVISWLCVVWLVSQCLCLKWFLSLFFRNLFVFLYQNIDKSSAWN